MTESQSLKLGVLPLNECYFAGENHTGIAAPKGGIIVLHVPTNDVWLLSPAGLRGSRSLQMARLYEGANSNSRVEALVQALRAEAMDRCGGELTPVHHGSKIETTILLQRTSVGISG